MNEKKSPGIPHHQIKGYHHPIVPTDMIHQRAQIFFDIFTKRHSH